MNLFTILAYKALYSWINKAWNRENDSHKELIEKHNKLKEEINNQEKKFLNTCEQKVSDEDIRRLIDGFNI